MDPATLALLAPIAKWGAVAAIVLGGGALLLRSVRKRGEADAALGMATKDAETRKEADHAKARSAASGVRPAGKFARLRDALRR